MDITSTYQHIQHDGHTYRRVSATGHATYWLMWEWPQNDTVGRWNTVENNEALEDTYRKLYVSIKEEIRQNVIKWIEALRSGRYSQCDGVLHHHEMYCCLGIGVECLYGEDIWIEDEYMDGNYYYKDGYENEVLYPEDRDKFGISIEDEKELTDMNDSGVPFPKIADWIESNILSRLGE